jgi:hypothetical protein
MLRDGIGANASTLALRVLSGASLALEVVVGGVARARLCNRRPAGAPLRRRQPQGRQWPEGRPRSPGGATTDGPAATRPPGPEPRSGGGPPLRPRRRCEAGRQRSPRGRSPRP